MADELATDRFDRELPPEEDRLGGEVTDEHGVGDATYALAPVGRNGEYRPSMSCLCGFVTGYSGGKWAGVNETWEETGQELDAHFEALNKEAK